MTDQPVSSVAAREPTEPFSPAARALSTPALCEALTAKDRVRYLAQLRAGAQRQLTDAQSALQRLAGTLGALAATEPQPPAQGELRLMAARAQAVRDAMAVIERVPGLPVLKPVEEQEYG